MNGQTQPTHAHPTFLPKRAKLFLCPSDAPSYVCWTLLRLIKHFMLTWHFLHGVASCDTFLAEAFSWLSRCCKWTLGQKLSGKVSLLAASQFAWHAAKTLPVSCQDFWTWSWSYHDYPFQTLSRIFIWQGRSDIKNGWGFSICRVCNMLITLFVEFLRSWGCISNFEIFSISVFLYFCISNLEIFSISVSWRIHITKSQVIAQLRISSRPQN